MKTRPRPSLQVLKRLKIKTARRLDIGRLRWHLTFDRYVEPRTINYFVQGVLKKYGLIKVYVDGTERKIIHDMASPVLTEAPTQAPSSTASKPTAPPISDFR
jgi:hypothetical protein